jgi:hypothetical protein
MVSFPDVDHHLFRRYVRLRPILWLLVAIWTIYFIRGRISDVIGTVCRCFTTILGWWWTVAKTLLVLGGQLCIVVPATGAVYLFAVYVIYPIISLAFAYFLDLVELAMSPPPPPPRSYQYTHTHSNGQPYTHTHDAEEMQEAFQGVFEEKLRERRDGAEREMRQQRNAKGAGKSKRKGKKRK